MKNLPSISIVTPTLNSDIPTFRRMLEEVKNQTYPKRLIEHIVMDAGSDNGALELAKKMGCKVTIKTDLKVQEQVRASLGIKKSKGDLVLMLQTDNIMTSKDWLKELVQPFLENKEVFCTYSAYNNYEKNMKIVTRYSALIGANDPTIYYLNKADKLTMIQKYYNKGEIIKETERYYVVKFTEDNLTTMGDNGHMFLKKAMDKVNKDPEKYIHVDAFFDLLKLGYDTYGVVKNSIIHTTTPDIRKLVIRRMQVKDTYYDALRGTRRYLVFNWKSSKDRINVFKYVVSSFTFVYPFFESIRGFIQIPDIAWFLHPFICFFMALGYSVSEIRWQIRRLWKNLS